MIETEQFREVCYRCRRARRVCLCGDIQAITPAAKVVFLQHPKEARNTVGTVRIAHLVLEGSEIIKGVDFNADPNVARVLREAGAGACVIYPGKDARPAEELHAHPGPLTIFLIDGTWAQARKMWNENPWLKTLPAYRLAPTKPGNYRIRKEPEAHCLATIEAVSDVLDLVANEPGRHKGLIHAFDSMVERQLAFVAKGGGRQHKKKVKRVRHLKVPSGFSTDNVVLMHAEGNGHPVDTPEHRLLELRMLRLNTGEERILRIRGDVPAHAVALRELDLQPDYAGIDETDVAAEVRAFLNGDPWCVGWGRFPLGLLKPYLALTRYFDLKPALVDLMHRRLGYVDDAAARLGLPVAPRVPSRGARRMASLTTVCRQYLAPAPQLAAAK